MTFQNEDLKMYTQTINNNSLLTEKEEKELIQKTKEGNTAARQKLIICNLRLVMSIAKKYLNHGLSYLDLIQEGNLGLIKAVDRFDLTKDVRFSTYAVWWIKQSIVKAVNEQTRNIKVPLHIIDKINKVKKAEHFLRQDLGREPTKLEMQKYTGFSAKELCNLYDRINDTSSLDIQVGEKEDDTLESLIEDTNIKSPESEFENEELKSKIKVLLSTLEDRESKIINLRFGLSSGSPLTLEDVGKQIGLSKERVRQIELKALKKLRNPVRSNQIKDYFNN